MHGKRRQGAFECRIYGVRRPASLSPRWMPFILLKGQYIEQLTFMGCWRHKEEPRGIIRNIVDTVKQQICVIKKKQKQICVINYNKIIMEYKVIGQE